MSLKQWFVLKGIILTIIISITFADRTKRTIIFKMCTYDGATDSQIQCLFCGYFYLFSLSAISYKAEYGTDYYILFTPLDLTLFNSFTE